MVRILRVTYDNTIERRCDITMKLNSIVDGLRLGRIIELVDVV